ncbi:MAG: 16S rRNA (guanine(966)-N(2))-methyltransferase RsmD [Flavobacteriaceae bacterium]|nr:MAG: 16S rRNA (guanine(966)-N(2))-methyltransferase RsmD [Flavobacteriaceae bacterium]
MRIISGVHKSKRLMAPKKLPVRPTTDMAKEALFNILNNLYYIDSVSVIDLFSGTGNISFEFGSRGCTNIVAVDAHFGCVKFIKSTATDLELPIDVIKSDVYKFLGRTKLTADIIFADPPYDFTQEQFENIVNLIVEKQLVKEDGLLIIEHSKQTKLENHPHFSYSKKYGGNIFSFFELNHTDSEEEKEEE